jgi:hypothetical protein
MINQIQATRHYQVPLSLCKKFKIPLKAKAPVITPNSKATLILVKAKLVKHPAHIVKMKTKQAPNTSKGV